MASFNLFIHNIFIQSSPFSVALLAFSDYHSYWHIPSIFNFKYSWLLASVALHHYALDHGLEPQPLPLKIAGVGANTLRISAPHKVQAGGS
jgi:hypothetical protein